MKLFNSEIIALWSCDTAAMKGRDYTGMGHNIPNNTPVLQDVSVYEVVLCAFTLFEMDEIELLQYIIMQCRFRPPKQDGNIWTLQLEPCLRTLALGEFSIFAPLKNIFNLPICHLQTSSNWNCLNVNEH